MDYAYPLFFPCFSGVFRYPTSFIHYRGVMGPRCGVGPERPGITWSPVPAPKKGRSQGGVIWTGDRIWGPPAGAAPGVRYPPDSTGRLWMTAWRKGGSWLTTSCPPGAGIGCVAALMPPVVV